MQLPSLLTQINDMDIERRKRGKILLEDNASKQQDLSFPSAPLLLWTGIFLQTEAVEVALPRRSCLQPNFVKVRLILIGVAEYFSNCNVLFGWYTMARG